MRFLGNTRLSGPAAGKPGTCQGAQHQQSASGSAAAAGAAARLVGAFRGAMADAVVRAFFLSGGLDRYLPECVTEDVDAETLLLLEDSDLKDMGLPKGPRVKILKGLVEYNGDVEQLAAAMEEHIAEEDRAADAGAAAAAMIGRSSPVSPVEGVRPGQGERDWAAQERGAQLAAEGQGDRDRAAQKMAATIARAEDAAWANAAMLQQIDSEDQDIAEAQAELNAAGGGEAQRGGAAGGGLEGRHSARACPGEGDAAARRGARAAVARGLADRTAATVSLAEVQQDQQQAQCSAAAAAPREPPLHAPQQQQQPLDSPPIQCGGEPVQAAPAAGAGSQDVYAAEYAPPPRGSATLGSHPQLSRYAAGTAGISQESMAAQTWETPQYANEPPISLVAVQSSQAPPPPSERAAAHVRAAAAGRQRGVRARARARAGAGGGVVQAFAQEVDGNGDAFWGEPAPEPQPQYLRQQPPPGMVAVESEPEPPPPPRTKTPEDPEARMMREALAESLNEMQGDARQCPSLGTTATTATKRLSRRDAPRKRDKLKDSLLEIYAELRTLGVAEADINTEGAHMLTLRASMTSRYRRRQGQDRTADGYRRRQGEDRRADERGLQGCSAAREGPAKARRRGRLEAPARRRLINCQAGECDFQDVYCSNFPR